MAHTTRLSILATLALVVSLPLAACHHHHGGNGPGTDVVVQERGGPPPHAPAHGYRRKQQHAHGELELVFDSGLGVYVVVGIPDLYFFGDHYFRLSASGWQVSVRHDSGWTLAAQSDVPAGLWKSKPGNAKKGVPPGQAKKGGGPPGPAKQR